MTVDELIESIAPLWQSVVFVIVALVFMYLLKLWRDWRTPFDDDHELADRGNLAVGLRRGRAVRGGGHRDERGAHRPIPGVRQRLDRVCH